MDHMQLVEKVREKAPGVSYEQAKEVLEKSKWDLLDALVLLEKQGVRLGKSPQARSGQRPAESKGELSTILTKLGKGALRIIKKIGQYTVEVRRNDELLFPMPLSTFLLLLIFACPITLPLALIGLFFHFRYSLRTPSHEVTGVNYIMDKASEVAENIRKNTFEKEDK